MISLNALQQYLNNRGIHDADYMEYISSLSGRISVFQPCTVGNLEYAVSHLLDTSDKKGYGLIPTNDVLNTKTGKWMAIGLIEGDDIICMDTQSGKIALWMIQTGDGEYLEVADSFKSFIEMCCPINE